MSAVQSDNGQDFDLNLAPIIDCFTVLITYLLVSASFISLIVLDVGVAAIGQSDGKAPKVPPYNLMIELGAEKVLTLKLNGGPKNVDLKIPLKTGPGGDFNLDGLKSKVSEVQRTYPGITEITVTAQPRVIYKDVVRVVEQLKTLIGKVFLSG